MGTAKGTLILSVVVSGGGSAALGLACKPSRPTVPAMVSPSRKRRRVQPAVCWARMEPSSLAQLAYLNARGGAWPPPSGQMTYYLRMLAQGRGPPEVTVHSRCST
jgi:hypothetical protein